MIIAIVILSIIAYFVYIKVGGKADRNAGDYQYMYYTRDVNVHEWEQR